mmetsp:Transcript_71858/g.131120  ORF Transcript_71858/g.131120 Transcript_71858/m.131120 type:complete len:1260 (+) Transcript_71858:63-3842(+)
MGQGLPKAVTPLVLERGAGPLFQIGLAEMNGWRPGMEDAHVVVVRDTWGFFGVFDGHGGQQCSAFVASRLTEELTNKPMPEDDAALKSLMLRIDKEFLDTEQPSGSTGTFAIVQPPDATEAGEKRVRLRVGNIGDSRVLLGRADGTIVEGPGTDGGLTTDHKPDNETERERIYRTGGTVETIMGVARVNGDLAVSRAFGDAPHKQTGGPNQEDHPVSVEPEFTSLSCDPSDFLMLVCDGISEGNFPNREVVKLAAEELRKNDPAQASAAVCRMALERGSMDNLSCMIVLFSGGEVSGPKKEFLPGPFTAPTHPGFRNAYAAMAERAGMSLEAAVEKRYDAARKERLELVKQRPAKGANDKDAEDVDGDELEGTEDNSLESIRAELTLFDGGPSNALAEGSKERTDWFKSWLDNLEELHPKDVSRDQLLELAERDPELLAMARAHGIVCHDALRTVRVAAESELRPALEAHAALEWAEGLSAMCGQLGKVVCVDPSDKTSQVQFHSPINVSVWLPSSVLRDEDVVEAPHTVHQERPARSSPQQRRFRFKTSRLTKKVKQVFIRSEKLRSRQGAAAKEFEARASAKEAGAKAAAEAEKDPLREALEPAQKAVEEKAAEIRNLRAKPNELEAVNAAAEAKAAAEAQARAAEANAATLILVEKREALKEQYRALEEKVAARLQAAEEKFVFAENMMSEINVKQTKLSMEADALEEERARCAKAKEFAQADLAAKQEAVQKTQRAAEEKLAAAESMMSDIKAQQAQLSVEAQALEEEKVICAKGTAAAEASLAVEREAVQKARKVAEQKLAAAEGMLSDVKAKQIELTVQANKFEKKAGDAKARVEAVEAKALKALSQEAKALKEKAYVEAKLVEQEAAQKAQKVAEEKLAAAEKMMSDIEAKQTKLSMEAKALEEEKAMCAKSKDDAEAKLAADREAVQKAQKVAEQKLAAAENMMSEVKAEQTKLSMEAEALQEEKAMDAKAKTVAEANLAAEQEAVQKIKKAAEEKLTAAENIMSETKAMQAKLSMEAKALEEERAMCARARAAAEEAQKVAEEKLAAAEETESKETTLSKKAAAEAEAIAEETAELMSKARRFLRSHFPLLPTSIFAEDVQVEMKGAEEQSSGDRLASALRDLLVAWARRAEAQISFERLAGPLERVDANYWYLQALCRIQVRGKQGPTDVQAHMTLRLNDNWQIFFVGIQKFIVNDEQLLAVEDVEALQRLWCTQSRQISLRTTSRSSPPARRMSGSRWNRLRSNAVVR